MFMFVKEGLSLKEVHEGRLYSVDWTRDWTRDWTVGLDSQKVALIILKHQNTTTYGDSCVGTPRVLGKLLAIIVLFRNFLFSGLQK